MPGAYGDTSAMSQTMSPLTNHFLIAMPGLGDPNFSRTVTFICEHGSDGAMGIVINRPMDLSLRDILGQMEIEASDNKHIDMPVY